MLKILFGWIGAFVFGVPFYLFGGYSFASIPIAHIKGVDELFLPQYKVYSPFQGLLHLKTTVPLIYKELESQESSQEDPLVKMTHLLFTKSPGGKLIPSHVHRNPGANLAPSTLAKIFIEFENFKNLYAPDQFADLKSNLLYAIVSDSGYQEQLAHAKKTIETEKDDFEKYQNLMNQNNKAESARNSEEKAQLKKLTLSLNNNDVSSYAYQEQLDNLVTLLATNFLKYDLHPDHTITSPYATSAILLSYLWSKGDSKLDLKDYLKVLAQANYLNKNVKEAVEHPGYFSWSMSQQPIRRDFFTDTYTPSDKLMMKAQFSNSNSKSEWVKQHFVQSVALSDGQEESPQKLNGTPPFVPFSYVTWVTYNILYADCAENAVHNIFNLITYNPSTKLFDANILVRLKEQFYPNLDPRVIEFYKLYSSIDQHNTSNAKKEWIELTVGLNDQKKNIKNTPKVGYMRARSEVKPSQSNLLKVVNAFLGYDDISQDKMSEVFERVREISGLEVTYSNPTKTGDYVDRREFKVGETTYVIKSWAGLHCIFEELPRESSQTAKEIAEAFRFEARQFCAARDYAHGCP